MWPFFGLRRVGKSSWAVAVIGRLGFLCLKVDCYEIQTEREMVTRAIRGIKKLEKEAPFFRLWLTSQAVHPLQLPMVESRMAQRPLRRKTSVLRLETRSRNSSPSRWSISCWMAMASKPSARITRSLPWRSRNSTTTQEARLTLPM